MTRGNTSEAVNLSRLLSILIFITWALITLGWDANFGLLHFQFTGLWEMSGENFFDFCVNFMIFSSPFVIVALVWHNLYKLKNKKLVGRIVYVTQHVTIGIGIFIYCVISMVLANGDDEDIYFVRNWIMDSFGTQMLAVLGVVGMVYGLLIIIFPPRKKG